MTVKKIVKKTNRIVATLIATLIFMTVFTSIPAIAETGVSVFDYNDYMVEYAVVNEWYGYQNIEVKLTNTGNESIYNWALKYDAGGEVGGLWNGVIS